MSDTYKRSEMYEEQIVVLDDWLKIDPSNKKAISHKKIAFEKLGKDASEVDKERWEKESSNLEYGILYLKSLMGNEMYEEAVEVSEEIMLYHDNDKRLLQLVSDAYIKNIDDKKALKYLEKLIEIDPLNNEYIIKLSNTCLNLLEFDKAYFWANKAIGLNKMLGKSFFHRAEVLVQLVDHYRSDELDFCDRLIFDLAVEDYASAYNNGVLNAKVYKNNLKELVTSVGDWFLLGDKFDVMSPDSEECKNIKQTDCYTFIKNREIKRKN
jgi:tetratricopeptide (TPR) repeat protein